MEFEWDPEKARINLAKHGVPFELASFVFSDEFRTEEIDDFVVYGEERWKAVGQAKGQFYAVIYTQRGDFTRIISARRATRYEQQNYLQQNSP